MNWLPSLTIRHAEAYSQSPQSWLSRTATKKQLVSKPPDFPPSSP